MTRNLRMTGAVAASDAARVLGDPSATGAERSAAASALAQAAHQARQTRAQAASDAARLALAAELSAAVLADLTGISVSTAERWSQWAKRDWAAYVGQRAIDESLDSGGRKLTNPTR